MAINYTSLTSLMSEELSGLLVEHNQDGTHKYHGQKAKKSWHPPQYSSLTGFMLLNYLLLLALMALIVLPIILIRGAI